mmetsp:Transcript_32835/g.74121  ORF Transcript_32835/g.74121 Transcript_32835/m.74121 type:complete len:200 (+) Transcript_32835:754-1353(+)
MPRAADLPRPRAAVRATVDRSRFSETASKNVSTARAWSSVLHTPARAPEGWASARLLTSAESSFPAPAASSAARATTASLDRASTHPLASGLASLPEMGRMLSSSSRTRQARHPDRLRMKRSLKRGTTNPCCSVRKRSWQSIVIVYSCLREVTVRRRSTTRPPPSTVSTVRARRLGVIASKSWRTSMPKVWPSALWLSL